MKFLLNYFIYVIIFLEFGNKELLVWLFLFFKVSKKALSFLSKMFILDLRKRVLVIDVFSYLYFNKYYDLDDEFICVFIFNFDFEK